MEPLTTMGSVSAIDGAIKKKQKTKQNKKKQQTNKLEKVLQEQENEQL